MRPDRYRRTNCPQPHVIFAFLFHIPSNLPRLLYFAAAETQDIAPLRPRLIIMRVFILGLIFWFLGPATSPGQSLYRMGQQQFATDCAGRLTDSGGPDGPYGSGENFSFTICPAQPTGCLSVQLAPFELEEASDFFTGDQLQFFAGTDTNAPLIASFDGTSGDTLNLVSRAECLTVVFRSNDFVNRAGFDLSWTCVPKACAGTSFQEPDLLNSLPVTVSSSTCSDAATFSTGPCGEIDFLNGPERIFAIDSPGDWCVDASLQTDGADLGLLVLNAPPDDPAAVCLVRAAKGQARGIDLRNPGRYYFVVAGEVSCGAFTLTLTRGDCPAPQGLPQALCNPLNACLLAADSTYALTFTDGFQDIPIVPGQNAGCWLDVGEEPDFRWFGLLTQAPGQLAFTLRSGDLPSDIDFNVWGPFDPVVACEDPEAITETIRTQPPIRSSFSGDPTPTGLLAVHPITGDVVTDGYDCGNDPGSSGDGYVRPVDVSAGQVYLVLVNDYGNTIRNGTILLDAFHSSPGVLTGEGPSLQGPSLLCPGDTAMLQIERGQGAIRWLADTGNLLDTSGFSVRALPQKTTLYQAEIRSFCRVDTVAHLVGVAGLNLPDSVSLCRGEIYRPTVLQDTALTYRWQASGSVELSCADCPMPGITGGQAGAGLLTGTQIADGCMFTDTVVVAITTDSVPALSGASDTVICAGEEIQLNANLQADVDYVWFLPQGQLFSTDPQPVVAPRVDTEYRVVLSDSLCGSTEDTVRVMVEQPVRQVNLTVTDNRICAGDSVTLRARVSPNNPRETFTWIGSDGTMSMDSVWRVAPEQTTDYDLLYDPGACRSFALDTRIQVEQPIGLSLVADPNPADSGEPTELEVTAIGNVPAGSRWLWTENSDNVAETDTGRLTTTLQEPTLYEVVLETPFGCIYRAELLVDIRAFRSEMPNAFSPNGDGVNDYFNLVYRGGEPEVRDFRIFNRWGQLVYDNETPEQGWDGTYRGRSQPADVYIYRLQLITPEGKEQTYEGEVTLIR